MNDNITRITMNRSLFITILLVLITSLMAFSQTMKVTDFKQTNDLSAVRFEKTDINGVPCGLIKVWLPMSDAKFVGNVIESTYKDGEWWVYMTKGSKRVTIKTSKYPPLVYEFPEPIQNSVTFAMTVVIDEKKSKTQRNRKCKPEKFTMEASVIGGTNLGLAMDFTVSYFLVGLGVDWMIISPEHISTTSLVNSGYTGNFTKTTTTDLSGSRRNFFFDLGVYFKYFSVSCQVGMLKTTVDRTSSYDGWGYGLVDGDLDEYWGSYEQRSFTNSTSDQKSYLTLTPQVKGYIPIGKNKSTSLSLGLGYTFIPTLNYYAGLSGNLGIHFRF